MSKFIGIFPLLVGTGCGHPAQKIYPVYANKTGTEKIRLAVTQKDAR
jgi:hypothetical protein